MAPAKNQDEEEIQADDQPHEELIGDDSAPINFVIGEIEIDTNTVGDDSGTEEFNVNVGEYEEIEGSDDDESRGPVGASTTAADPYAAGDTADKDWALEGTDLDDGWPQDYE